MSTVKESDNAPGLPILFARVKSGGLASRNRSFRRYSAANSANSEVTRGNGTQDSVIFYMKKTPEGWKAFDVHIDGVSYILSYREEFQSQIAQQGKQGIAAVIKRLESGEKPLKISHITNRGS
jgi:hypothetical protein